MPPTWLQIIATAFALSGWAKVIFDHISARPKIRGRVFCVMNGRTTHPQYPLVQLSSYMTYLYLYNMRHNSVHILDYEMELFIDRKWIPLSRYYGFHNLTNTEFSTEAGESIKFTDLKDRIINKKGLPAQYGIPVTGWLMFGGPIELFGKNTIKYRITCIDAYNKKHVFITNKYNLANINLVMEMEDLHVPESAFRN
jgi:hypothetical protein